MVPSDRDARDAKYQLAASTTPHVDGLSTPRAETFLADMQAWTGFGDR